MMKVVFNDNDIFIKLFGLFNRDILCSYKWVDFNTRDFFIP